MNIEIVIDCPDPVELATFYRELMGGDVVCSEPGWATIRVGTSLMSFQKVEDYHAPDWPGQSSPQQMHCDILSTDVRLDRARALTLGATALSEILDPGPEEWCVLADPFGHPFCLDHHLSDGEIPTQA